MEERKVASGRYHKRPGFYLDHDGSKYTNTFDVLDVRDGGEKPTGIMASDTGDSAVEKSNKRTVVFDGKEYPNLKEAIFAYEDAAAADQPAS